MSKYEHLKIQDDEDGHLIYVPGDVLKSRCKIILIPRLAYHLVVEIQFNGLLWSLYF